MIHFLNHLGCDVPAGPQALVNAGGLKGIQFHLKSRASGWMGTGTLLIMAAQIHTDRGAIFQLAD